MSSSASLIRLVLAASTWVLSSTVGVVALCLAISASTAAADLVLVTVDPTASPGLKVTGGSRINADGQQLLVESSSQAALVLGGSSQITAEETDIVGNYRLLGGSQFIGGVVFVGVSNPLDPLRFLPVPQIGPIDFASVTVKRDTTLPPGTYGSLSVQSGTATLSGTYTFTEGLKVSGSGRLVGDEVFMFFGPGAGVTLSSGAVVDLGPPPAGAGPYAGISIFFDRMSSAGFTSIGPVPASQRHIGGVVYVPSGPVVAHPLEAGMVIAATVDVVDGGTLNLTGPGL